MSKRTKGLGLALLVFSALYAVHYGYSLHRWGQYLPLAEVKVAGVDRQYRIYAPTNPPTGLMSVLLLLHGGDATADWLFPQQRDLEALAEAEGILIVHPVAKHVAPNEGAWQLNADRESDQDIRFIQAVIDDIAASHRVDISRVYALGYSLGSMFTYELVCHLSEHVAAVASFAGTMPVYPKACAPRRKVPILHIHGVADPIIAYARQWDWKAWDSVGTMQDIPSLMRFWQKYHGCQTETQTESAEHSHVIYSDCDQASRVAHVRLEHQDHGWPMQIGEQPTYRMIWSFLRDFSLP